MIRLGYTVCYVDDVAAVLTRFEAAFGLTRQLLTEDGNFAELDTGETTLCFAEREFGRAHFKSEAGRAVFDGAPRRFELSFVTDDVDGVWASALAAGMTEAAPLEKRSWGQRIGFLLDPEGILIEVASETF